MQHPSMSRLRLIIQAIRWWPGSGNGSLTPFVSSAALQTMIRDDIRCSESRILITHFPFVVDRAPWAHVCTVLQASPSPVVADLSYPSDAWLFISQV